MAYVIKRNRVYEYRSVRRDGKVTSEYVGCGGISAECAAFFHDLEAGRRAERALDQADRDRLAEAERMIVEADAAYDELATAALVAAGFHRPQRGRWRRRRTMGTSIAKPDPGPIIGEAEMNDLLDRIERAEGEEKKALQLLAWQHKEDLLKRAKAGDELAVPALRVILARRPNNFGDMRIGEFAARAMARAAASNDAFLADILRRELETIATEVAGPDPSPLEKLLAERVALTSFDAHECDCRFLGVTSGEGCSIPKADYFARQRDRANRRFLAACKALAAVQSLAMPILRLNVSAPTNAPARGLKASRRNLDSLTSQSN